MPVPREIKGVVQHPAFAQVIAETQPDSGLDKRLVGSPLATSNCGQCHGGVESHFWQPGLAFVEQQPGTHRGCDTCIVVEEMPVVYYSAGDVVRRITLIGIEAVMICLDAQRELCPTAYAKAEVGVGSIDVFLEGGLKMVPLQGGVPLNVAGAKHIGSCGGDEGIDSVLCVGGGRTHEGHSRKEKQGKACGQVSVGRLFFHCGIVFDY